MANWQDDANYDLLTYGGEPAVLTCTSVRNAETAQTASAPVAAAGPAEYAGDGSIVEYESDAQREAREEKELRIATRELRIEQEKAAVIAKAQAEKDNGAKQHGDHSAHDFHGTQLHLGLPQAQRHSRPHGRCNKQHIKKQ